MHTLRLYRFQFWHHTPSVEGGFKAHLLSGEVGVKSYFRSRGESSYILHATILRPTAVGPLYFSNAQTRWDSAPIHIY